MVLSTVMIAIVEISILVAAVSIGMVVASFHPGWMQWMEALGRRLSYVSSPEVVIRILAPYLLQPGIAYLFFISLAVVVPLIEEILKPSGVWLLAARKMTPTEGFALGALSGAGYALIESLMIAIFPEQWLVAVLARIGTGLLHLVTTGMMGWALVLAWEKRAYIRLGITYLSVVLLHSLWNSLSISSSTLPLLASYVDQAQWAEKLGEIAPIGLGLLALGLWLLLNAANRKLQHVLGSENAKFYNL
jgi:RsiW-degrading membrane proteinase PrsW (M82 family)